VVLPINEKEKRENEKEERQDWWSVWPGSVTLWPAPTGTGIDVSVWPAPTGTIIPIIEKEKREEDEKEKRQSNFWSVGPGTVSIWGAPTGTGIDVSVWPAPTAVPTGIVLTERAAQVLVPGDTRSFTFEGSTPTTLSTVTGYRA